MESIDKVLELSEKWNSRKLEIRAELVKIKGEKAANTFMEYYSRKYDKFQKELLDWRLCVTLLDDYYHCKKIGTRWYSCVGPGGTGKSTLFQNIFYFLDDKFTLKETNMNVKDFINSLGDESLFDGMRALFMDEPDDDIHPQTELGKKFRKVLGKARQGKFFFGTCATDLTDIPPYIFRKIDVIIFTPKLGHFMLIKNRPKIKQYPIQEVRKNYQKNGYGTFYDVAGRFSVLNGWTGQSIPFTEEELSVYKKDKWLDFKSDVKDIQDLMNKGAIKEAAKNKMPDRVVIHEILPEIEVVAETRMGFEILNKPKGKREARWDQSVMQTIVKLREQKNMTFPEISSIVGYTPEAINEKYRVYKLNNPIISNNVAINEEN